jgi:hypothetical protein
MYNHKLRRESSLSIVFSAKVFVLWSLCLGLMGEATWILLLMSLVVRMPTTFSDAWVVVELTSLSTVIADVYY